ncbi:MAG: response regulator transcription factor [Azospirillaceae bacterium]|nr:response regulator transcription factor [Azospirillaceae bacterium]
MRILIGDDHLLFREGLRRLLETFGDAPVFTEASTFDEVVVDLSEPAAFDLVLLDLQMPGWPGFSGLRHVVALAGAAPVVVISASESQSDIRAALDHGAFGYIPKSSSVKIMISALGLILSGGIYVPPGALHAPEGAAPAAATPGSDSGRTVAQVLTHRQLEVLNRLREGKSNKQIAYELGLSEGTVKIHVTAIFKSLGVKNRTQAVIAASEIGRN